MYFKCLFITISHAAIYGPSFLDSDQYFGFLLFNKIVGCQVCILISANKYLKLYLRHTEKFVQPTRVHKLNTKGCHFPQWQWQWQIITLKHLFHLCPVIFLGLSRGLIWWSKILWASPNIWKVTSSCIMCQVEKFSKRAANTSPTWRRLKMILLQPQGGREVI